ncbi:MAG: hypothetical protein M1839_003973 [Geoglossum umbratile]|nr:MAG: hypothetical protein M1839_003973 [Geoglossum umbratile]
MDSETAGLIYALQLQDIAEIHGKRKGKEREVSDQLSRQIFVFGQVLGDPNPDTYLAINLYCNKLERNMMILSDQRLTRSISQAVYIDDPALALSKVEEYGAIQDCQLAHRLSGSCPQTPLPAVVPAVNIDDKLAARLAGWNVFRLEGEAEDMGGPLFDREARESSPSNYTGRQYQESDIGDCVACGDTGKASKLMRAMS